MVDKNLFLHDLSVVAILKDEGRYLKEWLDYHLAAGVDHFYLYDHESSDNYNEIIKPYVQANLVTSIYFPDPMALMPAYNDAIAKFKFFSRYMAFIDLDEFIYPKTNRGIAEVVDEILSHDSNAAGLAIHWQEFGSNGHEAADYSRGVLQRFTRRAKKDFHGTFKDSRGTVHTLGNVHLKNISNPRYVKSAFVHHQEFFEGLYRVDERGVAIPATHAFFPVAVDKIAVNHYRCKSKEEYLFKLKRYRDVPVDAYSINEELFAQFDRNDEFDDGILHYVAERIKNFKLPDKSHAAERLFNVLMTNLSPTLLPNTPPKFYVGKVETFLTCRAVSSYLQTKLEGDAKTQAKFFEETALKALLRSLPTMNFADARLFICELPNLLGLPYPAVKDLRVAAEFVVSQVMNVLRMNGKWQDYFELNYILELLKLKL